MAAVNVRPRLKQTGNAGADNCLAQWLPSSRMQQQGPSTVIVGWAADLD